MFNVQIVSWAYHTVLTYSNEKSNKCSSIQVVLEDATKSLNNGGEA